MDVKIKENQFLKILTSENYNYRFDKRDGHFMRWGKTLIDNPQYGLPEIVDIEITTICNGIKGVPCPFCYKNNGPKGKNMSLDMFKKIYHKLPKSVTQIAFGVDAGCCANPNTEEIFGYCRGNNKKSIIPNVTVADISPHTMQVIKTHCGAVAVSRYKDKDICYNIVKNLTDFNMPQVNIHALLSLETYDDIMETFNDRLTDKRLENLNAIVLLSLKNKGRGISYSPISKIMFNNLVDFAFKNNINFGCDSCGAHMALDCIYGHDDYERLKKCIEPCESTCFSAYIDVEGKFFPCSFCPGQGDWVEGLDVVHCNDFIEDIWMHEKTVKFRNQLLLNGRNCIMYDLFQ